MHRSMLYFEGLIPTFICNLPSQFQPAFIACVTDEMTAAVLALRAAHKDSLRVADKLIKEPKELLVKLKPRNRVELVPGVCPSQMILKWMLIVGWICAVLHYSVMR